MTALVVGGAKRLGATICRRLAAEGHDIVVHYNTSAEEAALVAAECRDLGAATEIVQGDLSTNEGVENLASSCPDVAHLVFNAALFTQESAATASVGQWRDLFAVNVHAVQQLCRLLLPSIGNHKGSITALGVSGILGARAHDAAYCASMAARLSLVRSLALELAPRGVRVNMVSPGQLDNSVDYNPENQSHLPMGRAGTIDEVARVIAFLVDPASNYITGQNIEVAGGNRL